MITGTRASQITAVGATLEAEVDPNGASAGVFYQFQLLLDPGEAPTELLCPPKPPPGFSTCVGQSDSGALPMAWIPGTGPRVVSLDLSSAGVSLSPGRTYFLRLLAAEAVASEDAAEWKAPATVGATGEFATPNPPSISGESASGVSQTNAVLSAVVNDRGLAATYRFQISKEPACLPAKAPFATACPKVEEGNLPAGSLPASGEDQPVSLDLNAAGVSLDPSATYDFRVLATSAGGSSEGGVASFSTPPAFACPLSGSSSVCSSGPPNVPPGACKGGGTLVRYRRAGGVGGGDLDLIVTRTGHVRLRGRAGERAKPLGARLLSRLHRLLRMADFTDLQPSYQPASPAPDSLTYAVTYACHTVRVTDTAVPAPLRRLIEILGRIAARAER